MKFRTKILLTNVVLLAAAFAISGTLLMNQSYQSRLNREVTVIMDENQMIQASIESEVINRILRDEFSGRTEDWRDIGQSVRNLLSGTDAQFQILDADRNLLYGDMEAAGSEEPAWLQPLTENLTEGRKQYLIYPEEERKLAVASGMITLDQGRYYVVNQKDITQVFEERDRQVTYYQLMTLAALGVCGVVICLLSGWLMRPLIRLNKTTKRIAGGHYGSRVRVRTQDEIGQLGRNFNQMAETVQDHMKELEEENRRKEDFVANFTHELKTPLTSVIGYAELLSSQSLSEEERARAANYIFQEGLRLESMSMKLFDLILLNQEELDLRPVYVPDLMESIRESVEPLIEGDGKHLQVKPVEAVIQGDGTLLKTVFINILDNARKASPPGAVVRFVGQIQEDQVVLQVIDVGYGIPPEDVDKITEAFYMVDKSRSREAGGAGLGLSLAARILEKHGARLQVESQVGKGTTMSAYFQRET